MTLTGLYVPLITPFDESGGIAFDALETLAHQILDGGARGLVALGTTAEPSALTEHERESVLKIATQACQAHDAQLLVGANSPQALDDLRERPEVTAALTLVPPFIRPGEAGAAAYLTQLAATSPVPIVIYHVPYRTGQPLSAATIQDLAAVDNIKGIKYAQGGIDEETITLMADLPPDFAVLAGDDPYISPMLALGAHGGILASALVVPTQFATLIDAWLTNDVVQAREPGHRLGNLSQALFAEPNPTVIKAVLHARGTIPTPAVRPPLLQADPTSATRAIEKLTRLV
ncbi:4-hydroxy-tetrahydrodipicolinate synthase [Kribbella sp. VKM Ac-2527]|uniref:4-hydroxy-tetrahydrodipicolinate synthase n=1 Tax=Kribbella caucasensis TaxID=2512215 RepID=A0A4R6K8R7_9ACTN|nr:dihydrodipicolinate synthase family protein [Kribbella sp. VKM Ac-2527]TDO44356.1 4-hydroxy-tetrahydrodipicolinate synthase [Kribbella sp. VKM Ac-2527]